ncbi:MAG: hypothetical protein EON93_07350, partial [Burkholderiales bacterium]
MTISNRLFLGFGVIVLLMIGIGLFGVSQVSRVRETMDRVVERDFAMISELNTIFEAQAEATAATQDAVRLGMGGNPPIAEIDRAEQTYRGSITAMQEAVRRGIVLTDQYSSTALSAERALGWKRNGELLREIDSLLKTSAPQREEQFRAIRAGQTISTAFIEANMAQRRTQFLNLIGEMREVANSGIEAGRVRVRQVYEESQISTMGAIAAGVIIAIIIVLLLRRAIVGPIQKF